MVLSDTLAAGLTFVSAQAAPGMALNRAAVTSALPDPDPRNNEAALYSLARLPSEYIYLPLVVRSR